jgi:outer membrane cobalamin receptor
LNQLTIQASIILSTLPSGDQSKNAHAASNEAADSTHADIETVTVTGTHIRGVTDLPAPSQTMTQADMRKSGFTSLEDVARSLPQNLSDISPQSFGADNATQIGAANSQYASTFDLRGLGAESTLTLLNGERGAGNVNGRVFDISAIPLALIDHVDVVTGGASAVYGADAVAGVVNIVTRQDFDGAETDVLAGTAYAGAQQYQFDQIFGRELGPGGFVIAYNFSSLAHLDATSAGVAPSSSRFGNISPVAGGFYLVPQSQRQSIYGAAHYSFGDSVELHFDGVDTWSRTAAKSDLLEPGFESDGFHSTLSDQLHLHGSADVRLGASWNVNASGTVSSVQNNEFESIQAPALGYSATERLKTTSDLDSISVVANGTAFAFRGLPVHLALGGEYRYESYNGGAIAYTTTLAGNRTVGSLFAETIIPVAGPLLDGVTCSPICPRL